MPATLDKTTPIGTAYRVRGQRGEVLEYRIVTSEADAKQFRKDWHCPFGSVSVRTYKRTIKAGGYELDVIACFAIRKD